MRRKFMIFILLIFPLNVFASINYKMVRHDFAETVHIDKSDKDNRLIYIDDAKEYYYDVKTKNIVSYNSDKLEAGQIVLGNSYYLTDDFKKGDYAYEFHFYGCGAADFSVLPALRNAGVKVVEHFDISEDGKVLRACTGNLVSDRDINDTSCKKLLTASDNYKYYIVYEGAKLDKVNNKASMVAVISKYSSATDKESYFIMDIEGNVLADLGDYTYESMSYVKNGIYYFLSSYNGLVKFDIKNYSIVGSWKDKGLSEAFLSVDKTIYKYEDGDKTYFIDNGNIVNNKAYEKGAYISVINNKMFIVSNEAIYEYNTGKLFKQNLKNTYVLDNKFAMLFDSSKMYLFDGKEIVFTDSAANYKVKDWRESSYYTLLLNKDNKRFVIGVAGGVCGSTYHTIWDLTIIDGKATEESGQSSGVEGSPSTNDYTYEFIEGNGKIFDSLYSSYLVFKINGDHTLLSEVYIDGEKISSNQYSVTRGSTVITFDDRFSNTLKKGEEHTLKVVYSNGKELTTKFTIDNLKEIEDLPENPATGMAISIVFLVGMSSVAVVFFKKKKVINKI